MVGVEIGDGLEGGVVESCSGSEFLEMSCSEVCLEVSCLSSPCSDFSS